MPKVEPCPFPECRGKCKVEESMSKESSWIRCCKCGYESGTGTIEEVILAHNELSFKTQQAEQLIGNKDHPEFYCHRCGGRNLINWCADNDIWNTVMRGHKNEYELFDGIVCPICFVELAENKFGRLWRLVLEDDESSIEKILSQLHTTQDENAELLGYKHFAELAVPILKDYALAIGMFAIKKSEPDENGIVTVSFSPALVREIEKKEGSIKACLAALPEVFGDEPAKPMPGDALSRCCNAPPKIYTVDEGTSSYVMINGRYVCSKCNKVATFGEEESDG